MKTRIQIIQSIINRLNAGRYLEIGVFQGECFHQIQAPVKVAVDPSFNIPGQSRKTGEFYCQMTSDAFFKDVAPKIDPFDVVFIDGLHTYEQAYRDIQNSLTRLTPNGLMVVHDCNPTSEAMAQPAVSLTAAADSGTEGWTGEWCGDVWKTIVKLRSAHPAMEVFVLNCDYGVGILNPAKPVPTPLSYSLEEIEAMTYADLEKDRERLLNLKPDTYLDTILSRL